MTNDSTKRIEYLDCARGIGILLIVLGHVLKNGLLRQVVFSFNVPLFFLLAGQTYRYDPVHLRFWSKKAHRIVIPYFATAVFSILVYRILGGTAASELGVKTKQASLLQLFGGMLYGNSRTGLMKWNLPLWFLPCLMATILLADLLETAAVRHSPDGFSDRSRGLLSAAFLAAAFLYSLFLKKWILPWALEVSVFMCAFFEIGILIRKSGAFERLERQLLPEPACGGNCSIETGTVRESGKEPPAAGRSEICYRTVIRILVLFAVTVLFSLVNGFAQVRNLDYGLNYWLFLFTSITGSAGVLYLSVLLRNGRFLKRAGRDSLTILLFHKFPVLFFQAVCPGTKVLLKDGSSPAGILCALAVTLISVLLCLLAGAVLGRIMPVFRSREH